METEKGQFQVLLDALHEEGWYTRNKGKKRLSQMRVQAVDLAAIYCILADLKKESGCVSLSYTRIDGYAAQVTGRGYGRDKVFFFQAEDGIRDGRVTGVQTCALPI